MVGSLQELQLQDVITAIGGLGTAAFGLVDASKATFSFINRIGFNHIRDVVSDLTPEGASAGVSFNALPQTNILATLEANWANGNDVGSQKAIAQLSARAQHRRMLDGAGDDMLGRSRCRAHRAQHGQVIGFGAAAGENNLTRIGVDQRRHLAPRRLQPAFGRLPEMVDARRVTIHLIETRDQRLQNFRRDGSGGVVIEIRVLHLFPF